MWQESKLATKKRENGKHGVSKWNTFCRLLLLKFLTLGQILSLAAALVNWKKLAKLKVKNESKKSVKYLKGKKTNLMQEKHKKFFTLKYCFYFIFCHCRQKQKTVYCSRLLFKLKTFCSMFILWYIGGASKYTLNLFLVTKNKNRVFSVLFLQFCFLSPFFFHFTIYRRYDRINVFFIFFKFYHFFAAL